MDILLAVAVQLAAGGITKLMDYSDYPNELTPGMDEIEDTNGPLESTVEEEPIEQNDN